MASNVNAPLVLDETKPYSTVVGQSDSEIRYKQNGLGFNSRKECVTGVVQKAESAPVIPPAAEVIPPAKVEKKKKDQQLPPGLPQ